MGFSYRYRFALPRWALAALVMLLFSSLAGPPADVRATPLDTSADLVLGQPTFTSAEFGTLADRLSGPQAVAVDQTSGRLFVADTLNNRVLSWADARNLRDGQPADLVLGQTNFGSSTPGVSATALAGPQGLAVDAAGNLYVADSANHRVLVFSAPLTNGEAAAVVLGQPDFGSNSANNGGRSAATLNRPTGLAIDTSDNLYVADSENNRVVRFPNPLGGAREADRVLGQPDFTSGAARPAAADSLRLPQDVAFDPLIGALYVADFANNRVLRFDDPAGADPAAAQVIGQPDFASATANNGGRGPAGLAAPIAVAVDRNGNLYVADYDNHRVLQYDDPFAGDAVADLVFGQPDFAAGVPNNGGRSADSLAQPHGLALDQQRNLYVADFQNNRLLGFNTPVPNPAPVVEQLSPLAAPVRGDPLTVTVTGSGFVADTQLRWDNDLRPATPLSRMRLVAIVPPATGLVSITVETAAPGGGSSDPQTLAFYAPSFGDQIADNVIGQPDRNRNIANNGGISALTLNGPTAVARDRQTGRIYVADRGNHRVLSWPQAAAYSNGQPADLVLGQPDFFSNEPNNGGVGRAGLHTPTALAVDANSNLYVADSGNNRVLRFDDPAAGDNLADRFFGQLSFDGAAPNQGATPERNTLNAPAGLAFDQAGNLYVADSGNNRVLRFDDPQDGDLLADQVLGQPDFTSTNTNNLDLEPGGRLNEPGALLVDGSNNLYVVDSGNHRILQFGLPLEAGAVADLVIGQPSATATEPGIGNNRFNQPAGLAIDNQNNLYVADSGNNRVLFFNNLRSDVIADQVLGQSTFTTSIPNNNGVGPFGLQRPVGVALDERANLLVVDSDNHRVLGYDAPVLPAGVPAPDPIVTAVSPARVQQFAPGFNMTVNGGNFVQGAVVRWNGVALPTVYLGNNQLTAAVSAENLRQPGLATVSVSNPAPFAGVSNVIAFEVVGFDNQVFLPLVTR